MTVGTQPSRPSFEYIRTAALLLFATTLLELMIPVWNDTRALIAFKWTISSTSLVVAWLVTAIMPIFYFALYRNKGVLHFPRYIKTLSLVTAFVFGSLVVTDLWQWIGFFATRPNARPVSVLVPRQPYVFSDASAALAETANVAYVLLLLAFFLQKDDQPVMTHEAPASRLLIRITKIALVTYALWIAFSAVRLVLIPYFYFQIRGQSLEVAQTLRPLSDLLLTPARSFLSVLCLFMAPYAVHHRLIKNDPP